MKNEALLVIDMLNDFVLPGAPLEVPETRSVIKNIRREIDAARAQGKPVIYICDTHASDDKEFTKFGWPPHAVKGTAGAEVVAELKPAPGDTVIPKTTYSGFFGTTLEETLKKQGVKGLRSPAASPISASCSPPPTRSSGTMPWRSWRTASPVSRKRTTMRRSGS